MKVADRITLGLLLGFLSNIPKAILNEVFVQAGIEKKRFSEIVSGIFVTRKEAALKPGAVFGMAGDFVVASILGVAYVFLLSKSGGDKRILKGAATGAAGFGLFRGMMAHLGARGTYPEDIITNAGMALTSTLWGLTAGGLSFLLADEGLFRGRRRVVDLTVRPLSSKVPPQQAIVRRRARIAKPQSTARV
ncbi:MAG: hypothetical protein AB1500_04895 [Bacillota bacterium]